MPRLRPLTTASRFRRDPARRSANELLFSEAYLARLRRFSVLSRSTLSAGLVGEHRSRRRGTSPEFADFKRYSPGDDFRRIDWNTYARLDSLFVRISEVTTELDIHILLDASNSMDWRGSESTPTKFTYARHLAGSLGYVALWHFDRVRLTPFGATLAPRFGPAQGRNQAMPLLRYLEGLPPQGGTDLPRIINEYGHGRRRAGILFLISDLLTGEPDEIMLAMRGLRALGWHATVLHVLDPAELDPMSSMVRTGSGGRLEPTELIGVEDGQRIRLTPTDAAVAKYRDSLNAWLGDIEAACEEEAIDYVRLQSDLDVESVILRMLYERGIVG
jgi:uncharacterized protein (DUF58 family)